LAGLAIWVAERASDFIRGIANAVAQTERRWGEIIFLNGGFGVDLTRSTRRRGMTAI
jgi:hypothetical protein